VARQTELIGFQLSLPNALGESDLIRVEAARGKNLPYDQLSPSGLETLAKAIDHPETPIAELTIPAALSQLFIESGRIIHQTLLTLSLHHRAQPSDTHDVLLHYRHNLQTITQAAPTSNRRQTMEAFSLLNDPRFALPQSHHEAHRKAQRTIAHLIAGKVIDHKKQTAPFTATPPLAEITEMDGQTGTNHFPDPAGFTELWNARSQDETIHQALDIYLDQLEEMAVTPEDYGGHTGSFGFSAETRCQALLHHQGVIFSARLDAATRVKLNNGRTEALVIDYKSGTGGLIPETEAVAIAAAASLDLIAQMVLNLPDRPPRGRALKTPVNGIKGIPSKAEVNFKYLVLKSPPQIIDPAEVIGFNLHSIAQTKQLENDFADFLATVRHRPDLEPLLHPRQKRTG
jgi:hypothetical protein